MQEADSAERERLELLERVDRWMEVPMLVLAWVWLLLLVLELVRGSTPQLVALSTAVWAVFILHFVIEFTLAPRKVAYLRSNWLTALALLIPALRIARIAPLVRAFRAARGVRLIRVITSLNRGMRSLGASLGRRGFGYVVTLTGIVTLVGAAGIYEFEKLAPRGPGSYGEALWWTAMIMTTMGSEYWPRTVEGRLLCVVLALYAFAIFGYVSATLASYFIGRDAEDDATEVAGARGLRQLHEEIRALRAEIAAMRPADSDPPRPPTH
jgi:voltage-gated potassium channel